MLTLVLDLDVASEMLPVFLAALSRHCPPGTPVICACPWARKRVEEGLPALSVSSLEPRWSSVGRLQRLAATSAYRQAAALLAASKAPTPFSLLLNERSILRRFPREEEVGLLQTEGKGGRSSDLARRFWNLSRGGPSCRSYPFFVSTDIVREMLRERNVLSLYRIVLFGSSGAALYLAYLAKTGRSPSSLPPRSVAYFETLDSAADLHRSGGGELLTVSSLSLSSSLARSLSGPWDGPLALCLLPHPDLLARLSFQGQEYPRRLLLAEREEREGTMIPWASSTLFSPRYLTLLLREMEETGAGEIYLSTVVTVNPRFGLYALSPRRTLAAFRFPSRPPSRFLPPDAGHLRVEIGDWDPDRAGVDLRDVEGGTPLVDFIRSRVPGFVREHEPLRPDLLTGLFFLLLTLLLFLVVVSVDEFSPG